MLDFRFASTGQKEHSLRKEKQFNGTYTPYLPGRPVDEIVKGLEQGEGCRITGVFYKHFAANTFAVTLGNPFVVAEIARKKQNFDFDFSHRINSLTFGEKALAEMGKM